MAIICFRQLSPSFRRLLVALLGVGILSSFSAVGQAPDRGETTANAATTEITPPAWSHSATIYEVNLRQYSPAGTFAAFAEHLPRLKEMGVKILWLMPIHPIGEKHRKGLLGSYYSVKDYRAVNPEHGTLEDFKTLVRQIHALDMYIILDWVANHTAWDSPLIEEHPDWFTRDETGNPLPPVPDWSDVIDLDYDHPELRRYMIESLKFWVEEADIDGYRCDVAGMVPLDFWNRARTELEEIKPVFMLAEAEGPEFHQRAFDMSYSWKLHKIMNRIARGEENARAIDAHFAAKDARYPPNAYRMQFTSNHDENSWNGTVFERLGEAAATFAVLSATVEGMPLVYSGQEAGLDKRLAFFKKDVIEWRNHEFAGLYTTLLNLNLNNQALWNGIHGGGMQRIYTARDSAVYAFTREKAGDKVLAIFNLTPAPQAVSLTGETLPGNYRDAFSGETRRWEEGDRLSLRPWEYYLYVR